MLIQLDGRHELDHEQNLQELFEAYHPADWKSHEGRSLQGLAKDKDFMLKFRILQFAKFHNKYSEADQIMRQFAKVCTQLPQEHYHVAKKLEYALNTDVVVKDPSKVEVLPLLDRSKQEYHTLDGGVVG